MLVTFSFAVTPLQTYSQVPGLLNYQGRISVGATPFEGNGLFKLALVNSDASQIYWRNAPDANNDGEPDSGISVSVSRGLYSLMLGDTTLANMQALPATVFNNSAVFLRVWFNDGFTGFQQLVPDQRVSSVGYSLIAANVSDGAVTAPKLDSALNTQVTDLMAEVAALSSRLAEVESDTSPGLTVVSTEAQDEALIAKGYRTFSSTTAFPWANGANTGAPGARSGHSAIWTGDDMIVWGGYLGAESYSASGGRYSPAADTWTAISGFGAPAARQSHSAVWTGNEMIIWGGFGSDLYIGTGGRYVPASQSWSAISTATAPSARSGHVGVWTGGRMIVWGGRSSSGYLADGASYNPVADSWAALSSSGAPEAREGASVVQGNNEMLVWGGEGSGGALNTGGRLSFDTDGLPQGWQSISTANAPSARVGHTAVWTGAKMIVWGGQNGTSFLGDGAIYDPAANTWIPVPTTGAPSARSGHAAVWTGTEMLVFGGVDATESLSHGGAYDIAANKWRSLSAAGNPVARDSATAIWTGTEILIFGGHSNGQPTAALQRLNPQPAWHFYRKL